MAKDSTQPKQPPGRPAWARGSKFKLLESHLTDWEQARAQKRVSAFYDRITTLFVVMYGYDLPLKQDGLRLCEEDEVNIDAAPTVEGLTQAEALARSKYHKKVRDVSQVRVRFRRLLTLLTDLDAMVSSSRAGREEEQEFAIG